MSVFPQLLDDYFLTWMIQERSPAYLCLDQGGHLIESGGHLELYRLSGLRTDQPITSQLYFLEGLVPLQGEPIVLPCVKVDLEFSSDIHILHAQGKDWVLFFDTSTVEMQSTRLQQTANDLSLLRAKQAAITDAATAGGVDAEFLAILLRALEILVLKRISEDSFQIVGEIPDWFKRIFPEEEVVHPGAQSHFLRNFLIDADEFWNSGRAGILKSGPWCEMEPDLNEVYLEATAICVGGAQVLLIEIPRIAYEEKHSLIQKGREHGLVSAARERENRQLRNAKDELEHRVQQSHAQIGEIAEQLRNKVVEHQKTEEALHESEISFQRIIEFSPLGILIVDTSAVIHLVNPALVDMLGAVGTDELLGRKLFDFCVPDEVEASREMFNNFLVSQEETLHTQNRFQRMNREEFPAEVDMSHFQWGGKAAVQMMIRDVTERVRAEEALRNNEEQLRQAQKMEAVGRLAGGVAHDFNNLLTAIIGYGELVLANLEIRSPLRSDVEEILSAGEKACELTQQLLVFSRKQILKKEVINLNSVVMNMEKLLRRLIGEDINLVVLTDPKLGNIQADPGQIEQVIMNLAVNARDAMPLGGKLTIETVTVRLDDAYCREHLSVRPGSYVMLMVADTGCGMNKEIQGQIFEPFFTTKPPGKGTGLGLSTVYAIVTQSGGSIWLSSEPDEGTTFKIYLPCVEGEAIAATTAPSEPGAGTETILVVEDDGVVRSIICTVLRRKGYDVLGAPSPSEATRIAELHTGPIHLLLTDTVMPEISGPELARQQTLRHPEMKVLFISGYADDTLINFGILNERTPFLEKPFTPEILLRKVRQLLDGDTMLNTA